ncbi:hypothetical protein HAX54_024751 [Datura stramonium]|uniref:Uncharacterized protein n=1 Tax=Datura stramonium TaxID=4076 RepID=A0ABS8S7F3_DATST|nr:hypothetical protein [Datura stramonium]
MKKRERGGDDKGSRGERKCNNTLDREPIFFKRLKRFQVCLCLGTPQTITKTRASQINGRFNGPSSGRSNRPINYGKDSQDFLLFQREFHGSVYEDSILYLRSNTVLRTISNLDVAKCTQAHVVVKLENPPRTGPGTPDHPSRQTVACISFEVQLLACFTSHFVKVLVKFCTLGT